PFDTSGWKNLCQEDVLRKLRESDPVCPSTKIGASRETASKSASARGTDPKQLTRLLRGDLDWITLKAIDHDRDRLYPTPLALATDLQNHLKNRPVTAHAASIGYRVRKYVRRHAAGVAVGTLVVGVLAAFSILQALQLRR